MSSDNNPLIQLDAQQRRSASNGLFRMIEGLRVRSPALALAASQALSLALGQRNGQALLLKAGLNEHTIAWLHTLTDGERLRACQAIEAVVPAAVFNAQAAIKYPIDGPNGLALDHSLMEHYLLGHGAHAGMMSDVCGMSEHDHIKRLKQLGLPSRKGRPAQLSHESVRGAVLDAWARLQRSELLAIQRAAKQGEAYQAKSTAALYLELHYQFFANESLAAIYNVLCDVPTLQAELGSAT
jgi:hypothetical protein